MTDNVTLWLSERLVAASLQGAGVIALIWLVCRSLPSIPASVRAALWWLAALKLVLVLLPVPAVPIPILPAALDWTPDRAASAVMRPASAGEVNPGVARVVPVAASAVAPRDEGRVRWLETAIVLWLGMVVLQAARLLVAFRELHGVVRRSVPGGDQSGAVARLASLVGLAHAPQVRTSDEIDAPQVAGLWRPVVLVPAEAAADLSADERAMTLCHELMHIRRHDLALGWVPALAERLFFFHPLARLAGREYLTSRESACDAAVLQALQVSPTDYGRMLVRLGVGGSVPALTAGGSSPSLSSLKRRLEMLQHAASPDASRRSTWLIAIVGCALIPLQLVAGTPAAPQAPQEAPPAAAPEVVVPAVPGVPPAETSAPRAGARVGQAPVETARVQVAPVDEAAKQDARAATVQETERALSELVNRFQDAEAVRHKAAELAIRRHAAVENRLLLEAERAGERERIERQMKAALESASQQVQDLLRNATADDERVRNEAIQQQIRDASARARSQIDQNAHSQLLDLLTGRQQAGASLDSQLEVLKRQLEALTQQLKQLMAQQEQLAAAQKRLSEQADLMRRLSEDAERLRKALDAK